MTVVDGDTHRRVKGARVVIGKRSGYANTRGLASVKIKRRAALPVRVSKPGYGQKVVRMPFKRKREVTVRLYRDDLQWTMYGANNRRTQAPADIKVRPPFKVVWSRGVGSLVEFPAVVADGVAYVANYKGHIYALRMSNGKVIWRHRPSRGKMASSPAIVGDDLVVHGMDGIVRVLDRRNGRAPLALPRRLADRVVADRLRRARLLRRLERSRLRARPEAAEAALDLSRRATRSPRARRSRGGRSTSATTAAACTRSPRARASAASSARSTAASTGRRPSPRAASSSPRRPATA